MGVTANFFPMLRVPHALGRNFLGSEDRKDGPAVVILSHRLWQSRLNSDPAIIGRSIMLAGKAQTVVGILPAHFVFPDPAAEPDLYIPAAMDADTSLESSNISVVMMMTIARLRDNVTLSQAQADLDLFERQRVKGYGPFFVNWAEGRKMIAQPLQRYLTGDNREPLLILLACVAAVLLIACVNVANLQLARTIAREPEMALRGALGAGRQRVIRQALVENFTLSAIASVLGLAIAARLLPHRSAYLVTGGSTRRLLRSTASTVGQRFARLRDRPCRDAAYRSALLIRRFAHVLQNGSSFNPHQSLTATVQRNRSKEPEKTTAFTQQLLPRLKALPGVKAAAIGSALPLEDIYYRKRGLAFGEGPPLPVGQRPEACAISITGEYFTATGTGFLQGRAFTQADDTAALPVAIVNQAFARKYLNGDALDKEFRIKLNGHNMFTPITVVGIVEDVHYGGLEADIQPVIYLPFDQVPERELDIVLRSSLEPVSLAAAMRKAVIDTDPLQPLFDVAPMESRLSQSLAERRLLMLLIAAFAVLAMILAGVGVYGVFSYWVSHRRQEMAIRLALGSSRPELLRLIVLQAMRLILTGGVIGIAGAWFLDRLLASMLVGVNVHDPISLSLAWSLMTLIALTGSCVPARNAARTNMTSVLHSE